MSTRALRQYYEPVTATVPDVTSAHGPWLTHRRRFVDELRPLPDPPWHTVTRCAEWDVKGVVSHLVTSAPSQLTALVVALAAIALTIARRDTVAYRRTA